MLINIELWILTPLMFADPWTFSRRDAGKPKLTDSKIAVVGYSLMPDPQLEKYCGLEADPADALSVCVYTAFQSVLS